MPDDPIPLSEVLREEFVRLHDDLPEDTVAALRAADEAAVTAEEAARLARTTAETKKLKAMYDAIHARNKTENGARVALCLSGGGIRSATFALGIMQRLAECGLLKSIDYLSTVSGGGYIGSWLSSYIRREGGGIAAVETAMAAGDSARPVRSRDPLDPEIRPVTWLRRFSNYLTPKLGLMSADTWAFAGSYFRNLLLVWLMFIPFLAAVLALPRLAIALLHRENVAGVASGLRLIAGLMILIGTCAISCARPVSDTKEGWLTNGKFLRWVLLPYTVAAMLLAIYWLSVRAKAGDIAAWLPIFIAFIGINVIASLVYMVRYARGLARERQRNVRSDSTPRGYLAKKLVFEVIAAAIAGAAGAGLLYAASRELFDDPAGVVTLPALSAWYLPGAQVVQASAELYLCCAVPLVLGILFAQSMLFVGLSSWFNEEYDREWWGRAGGWVLFAAIAWMAITAITVYGPVAIYYAPKIYTALTGVTGVVAILLGKSGISGATDREKDEKAGPAQTATNVALGVVGPVFVVAILSLISLCTSRILLEIRPPDPRTHAHISAQQLALYSAGTYQLRQDDTFSVSGKKANFETARFPAVDRMQLDALHHLWVVDTTTPSEGIILFVGLGAIALLVSFFVGANQFSMHGLYRNRLIRGFLGASNRRRRPNAFSGFDPDDDLAMNRLRPEMFCPSTFRNIEQDGPKLIALEGLSFQPETRDAVNKAKDSREAAAAAACLLAEDLNRCLDTVDLTDQCGQLPRSVANRRELERRFPAAFEPMEMHRRPLHVVGTTLNLVNGQDLGWQERKGAAFAISPLYSGNPRLGYRRSYEYGGPSGISLGTAVAISGAAASPNMGYHSSPALSFLLTLFNVRLGWWLGNPRKARYRDQNPRNTLVTILDEAFGLTGPDHDYVYLSDGGHFDNLGLYEMVLRRCRYIIVSDAGADPEFGFDDLGNAIRKIRVDLGIDIDITNLALFPRSRKDPSHPKYCAIATIRYSQVDGPDAQDGCLLYLKPAFYGTNEPKDVYNYGQTYKAFPHQSTGDQWFSESQFESYRQLGYFALKEVTKKATSFTGIDDLFEKAWEYVADQSVPAVPRTIFPCKTTR